MEIVFSRPATSLFIFWPVRKLKLIHFHFLWQNKSLAGLKSWFPLKRRGGFDYQMLFFFPSPLPIKPCPLYTLAVRLGQKVKCSVSGVMHPFVPASPESCPLTWQPFALSFSFSQLLFLILPVFLSVSGSVSPMFVRLPCGGIGVSKLSQA